MMVCDKHSLPLVVTMKVDVPVKPEKCATHHLHQETHTHIQVHTHTNPIFYTNIKLSFFHDILNSVY